MARTTAPACLWILAAVTTWLGCPGIAFAQAGPPYMTNDPGTPGHGNWEINLAVAPSLSRDGADLQVPQVDLNFGLGDRIQLTYEIPYVVTTESGQPRQSGWGNAIPGIKWRFLDQGEDGWAASVFPQVETPGPAHARAVGIATPAPRYLLPLEAARKLGPIDIDFEIGQYFGGRGPRERILGVVAGRALGPRFEMAVELYDDRAEGTLPHQTTIDVGGRYKLHPGIIALFMAGRTVGSTANGAPQIFGYFGVQILLRNYGLELDTADH